eukprot:gene2341-2809_t
MSIAGITFSENKFQTLLSLEEQGTDIIYLDEMLTILQTSNSNEVSFSYDHAGTIKSTNEELVKPVWTPEICSQTSCGWILRTADDLLKQNLKHLTNMTYGTQFLESMTNLKSGDSIKVQYSPRVSRIRIKPKEIVYEKFENSIYVSDVKWEIEFDMKTKEGVLIPIHNLQKKLMEYYEKEVENITKKDPQHAYSLLRKVFIAQELAKFIIQNKIPYQKEKVKNVVPNKNTSNFKYENVEITLWNAKDQTGNSGVITKHPMHDGSFHYYNYRRVHGNPDDFQMCPQFDENQDALKGFSISKFTTTHAGSVGGVILKVSNENMKVQPFNFHILGDHRGIRIPHLDKIPSTPKKFSSVNLLSRVEGWKFQYTKETEAYVKEANKSLNQHERKENIQNFLANLIFTSVVGWSPLGQGMKNVLGLSSNAAAFYGVFKEIKDCQVPIDSQVYFYQQEIAGVNCVTSIIVFDEKGNFLFEKTFGEYIGNYTTLVGIIDQNAK